MPTAAVSTDLPSAPLRVIAEAAAAATRQPVVSIRARGPARALFVALAYDQGWDRPEKLADVCGCCRHTITNLARDVDPAALHAAKLCLQDARLRRLPAGSRTPPFAERITKRV